MKFNIRDFKDFIIENKDKIILGVMVICFLFAISIIKDFSKNNNIKYIDDKPYLVLKEGIKRYDIKVKGNNNGIIVEKNVSLNFKKKKLNNSEDKKGLSKKQEVEDNIENLARNLGKMGDIDRNIYPLPKRLKDGTILRWKNQDSLNNKIIILCLIPIFIFFYYMDFRNKKLKVVKNKKKEIIISLPEYINKILLGLNSGIITIRAIIDAGDRIMEKDDSLFSNILKSVKDKSKVSKSNYADILYYYALEYNEKNFIKISYLFKDSISKGVDIRDKLAAEGELLLRERRRKIEEEGKLAETKLVIPMAILLLSLIIIIMGPIIIDFKG